MNCQFVWEISLNFLHENSRTRISQLETALKATTNQTTHASEHKNTKR